MLSASAVHSKVTVRPGDNAECAMSPDPRWTDATSEHTTGRASGSKEMPGPDGSERIARRRGRMFRPQPRLRVQLADLCWFFSRNDRCVADGRKPILG